VNIQLLWLKVLGLYVGRLRRRDGTVGYLVRSRWLPYVVNHGVWEAALKPIRPFAGAPNGF